MIHGAAPGLQRAAADIKVSELQRFIGTYFTEISIILNHWTSQEYGCPLT